jgi:hypothetical protein
VGGKQEAERRLGLVRAGTVAKCACQWASREWGLARAAANGVAAPLVVRRRRSQRAVRAGLRPLRQLDQTTRDLPTTSVTRRSASGLRPVADSRQRAVAALTHVALPKPPASALQSYCVPVQRLSRRAACPWSSPRTPAAPSVWPKSVKQLSAHSPAWWWWWAGIVTHGADRYFSLHPVCRPPCTPWSIRQGNASCRAPGGFAHPRGRSLDSRLARAPRQGRIDVLQVRRCSGEDCACAKCRPPSSAPSSSASTAPAVAVARRPALPCAPPLLLSIQGTHSFWKLASQPSTSVPTQLCGW